MQPSGLWFLKMYCGLSWSCELYIMKGGEYFFHYKNLIAVF